MEIASLLAEKLGKELVIENMDFDAVCLSVSQQKCDIAMAGLTVNEERQEYVNFSDTYYQASQRLIVPSNDTAFDDCKSADDVAAKLAELKESDKIGVQQGTTGQYYVEGSEDWDFPGLPAKCVTYKSGSLAVQEMHMVSIPEGICSMEISIMLSLMPLLHLQSQQQSTRFSRIRETGQ